MSLEKCVCCGGIHNSKTCPAMLEEEFIEIDENFYDFASYIDKLLENERINISKKIFAEIEKISLGSDGVLFTIKWTDFEKLKEKYSKA